MTSNDPYDFIDMTSSAMTAQTTKVQPPFTPPTGSLPQVFPAQPAAGPVTPELTSLFSPQPPAVLQSLPAVPTKGIVMSMVESGAPVGLPAVIVPSGTAPTVVPTPQPIKSVATDAQSAEIERRIFGTSTKLPPATWEPVSPPIVPGSTQQVGGQYASTEDEPNIDNFESCDDDGECETNHCVAQPVLQSVQPLPPVIQSSAATAPQVDPPPAVFALPSQMVTNTIKPTPSLPVPPQFPEAIKGLFNHMVTEVDLGDSASALQQLEADAHGLWFHSGIGLLHNHENRDPSNLVHEVLFFMRWQPDQLFKMDPNRLCKFEVLLSAHAVWMHATENQWKARHEMIGNELDRLCFKKRDQYTGATVGSKEGKMFEAQPNMRQLRLEYMRAWAMHSMLEGMGDTFKHLENGLKRTIDKVTDEYKTSRISNGSR